MPPRSSRPPAHGASNAHLATPLHTLQRALAAQARTAETFRRGALPVHPTHIVAGGLGFLISSDPGADGVAPYRDTLAAHNVAHVVRVCAPTYDEKELRGTPLTDLYFPDGEAPPADVVEKWLKLLDRELALSELAGGVEMLDVGSGIGSGGGGGGGGGGGAGGNVVKTVAVHCAAGVGRAPVLVALALVELGLEPFDAVAAIRTRRRGAINMQQASFLSAYVPRSALAAPSLAASGGGGSATGGKSHRRSRSGSMLGGSMLSFLPKGFKVRPSSRPGTPPRSNTPPSPAAGGRARAQAQHAQPPGYVPHDFSRLSSAPAGSAYYSVVH